MMTPDRNPVAESCSPAAIPELKNEEWCVRLEGTAVLNRMTKYLMVGLGGALGSILRFWVGGFIGERMGSRFPYGTFVVNCTGSFLVGFIVTLLANHLDWSPNWKYLLPIGFIGGYTTFSAFELETFRSFEDGAFMIAALNVSLSVTIGFISVWLGVIAGRRIS
jgi:CrcB protein